MKISINGKIISVVRDPITGEFVNTENGEVIPPDYIPYDVTKEQQYSPRRERVRERKMIERHRYDHHYDFSSYEGEILAHLRNDWVSGIRGDIYVITERRLEEIKDRPYFKEFRSIFDKALGNALELLPSIIKESKGKNIEVKGNFIVRRVWEIATKEVLKEMPSKIKRHFGLHTLSRIFGLNIEYRRSIYDLISEIYNGSNEREKKIIDILLKVQAHYPIFRTKRDIKDALSGGEKVKFVASQNSAVLHAIGLSIDEIYFLKYNFYKKISRKAVYMEIRRYRNFVKKLIKNPRILVMLKRNRRKKFLLLLGRDEDSFFADILNVSREYARKMKKIL